MVKIRKPRRLAAILATITLAATLGTISLTQSTANAANWRNCEAYSNVLCLYNWIEGPVYPDKEHRHNNLGRFTLNIPARRCVSFTSSAYKHIDNKASSAFLEQASRDVRVELFETADCNQAANSNGRSITLTGPGGKIGNLNKTRSGNLSDKLSSFWIQ